MFDPGRIKPGRVNPESEPSFLKFWAEYPRKAKKPDAARAFAKIAPGEALLAAILAALSSLRRSDDWLKNNGSFVPYPASWLNQRRWEEVGPAPTLPDPRERQRKQLVGLVNMGSLTRAEAETQFGGSLDGDSGRDAAGVDAA